MQKRFLWEEWGRSREHISMPWQYQQHTPTKKERKKTCCMVVDSHFLRSKPSKCMEIVSNPAIMDVAGTMGSYGPSSVLLAVIALLLKAALSAAQIGKVHRKQALAAIHNCVFKRGVKRREWWLSVLDICDLRLAAASGDGRHNRAAHLRERRPGLSTEQSMMGTKWNSIAYYCRL